MKKPEHLFKAAAIVTAVLVCCLAQTVWAEPDDRPELSVSDYEEVYFEETNNIHEHSIVIDEGVEPGLFHTGLTEGSHCAECGEVIVSQQVIPAKSLDSELAVGSWGEDVTDLQGFLNYWGYMEDFPDGSFGPVTESAVCALQAYCGLESQDGVFDNSLLTMIQDYFGIYHGTEYIDVDAVYTEESETAEDTEDTEDTEYGKGGSSADISEADVYAIQDRLYNLGYLEVEPTGYFGDMTKDALLRFQIDHDLPMTMEPDEQTLAALFGTETDTYTEIVSASASWDSLHFGSYGDDVYELQAQLQALGYLYDDPDGDFGYITQSAVEEFQANNGLAVTGEADVETRTLLYTQYASVVYAADEDIEEDDLSESYDVEDIAEYEDAEDYAEEEEDFDYVPVSSNVSLGQQIVDYAMQWVGVTPYVDYWERFTEDGEFFNSLTDGTDCSGFVHLIFDAFGIYVPTGSDAYQNNVGVRISEAELLPGDIVVYRYGGHVGIYAGDGMLIHCSTPERGTVYDTMWYAEPTAYVRVVF